MTRQRLVLASASPRRQELLSWAGLEFDVLPSEIDESILPGEGPVEYARRLALNKSQAVAEGSPDRWILSADTVVALEDLIMGKPKDRDEAVTWLAGLSGRAHQVVTGFCLFNKQLESLAVDAVITIVEFRPLSSKEIDLYLDSGEAWDKAGAYAIQGRGAMLIDKVAGSYTNVIGLPLAEVLDLLRRFDLH